MAFNVRGFNAAEIEPNNYEDIPAGTYVFIFGDASEKETKNGDGRYAELVGEVTEGDLQGRKFWERLNLDNPNEKAVEIAQRTLSSICRAAGKMVIDDTAELLDIPMMVTIKYVPKKNGQAGELEQRRSYKALGAEAATTATASRTATAGSGQAAAAKKPWQR